MTCNLFIHMPLAAHATYVKCLCMPGVVGCSRSPFNCSVQSEHGWLHIALPAAQLQANDLKTACSAAATCRIICKKVARTLVQ